VGHAGEGEGAFAGNPERPFYWLLVFCELYIYFNCPYGNDLAQFD
jgi:hypothetical protein